MRDILAITGRVLYIEKLYYRMILRIILFTLGL